MSKVLVLYYSSYGHVEQMANAAAEGAREAGAQADVKRVPETVPDEVARSAHFKLDQAAPVADVDDLPAYDAIILAMPTRYGRMPSQMAAFWDQAGKHWATNALVGKIGAVLTSTAAQHGGQETTLFSGITNLMHMGFVIVGLPYTFRDQMGVDTIRGGSPYGATTISDSDGHRQPAAEELAGARFQGRHVAEIAAKLFR